MSHSVADGARRYLEVAGYDSGVTGQFFASPGKRMAGQIERMELPHIDDRRAQRAGWNVIVKVSGVDTPARPSRASGTTEADLAAAA